MRASKVENFKVSPLKKCLVTFEEIRTETMLYAPGRETSLDKNDENPGS